MIKPICRSFIQTNHSYSKETLSTLQTFHYSWPPGNSEAASSWKSLPPKNSKENNSAAGKAEGGIHQFSRNIPEFSSLGVRNHREEREKSLSFCRTLISVSSLHFCHIFAFWPLQPQRCQLRAEAPPDTKIYIFLVSTASTSPPIRSSYIHKYLIYFLYIYIYPTLSKPCWQFISAAKGHWEIFMEFKPILPN